MFLEGFPEPLQGPVRHKLAIVKPDLHPDDPYQMDDVIAAGKFLTGSAFRSSILPADLAPVANVSHQNPQHPAPYRPFQGAAQPTAPIPSFNPPPALKTEANTAARGALLCNFCADGGTLLVTSPVFMSTSTQERFLELRFQTQHARRIIHSACTWRPMSQRWSRLCASVAAIRYATPDHNYIRYRIRISFLRNFEGSAPPPHSRYFVCCVLLFWISIRVFL